MNTKIFTLAFAFFALSVNGQINRPMPVPGPVPTINLGKSHEFKLNNGLTVIVVENHKLPRVSATLTIDNTPFTLADKKGVDGLLGSMLGTGTEKVAKDDYNKKIEQLGGNVNFWSEGGSASSLTKYFDEVFGYFADGVINPKFDQKEFEAVKNRYIEGLKADEKSVEAAASRVRDVLTYGKNHPFAEYDTPEKIQKITLKDVQDFYKNYYRPDNAYLIFVGDITADKAKSLTTKLFSNWHKGVVKIADLPSVQQVKKTEVDIVNMPNAVQSVVSVTYPVNLTKKDKDYYAVQVASTILGGDFNSKLNMNLREKHGWTYGARGGVSDSRYIGRFFTNATVRNEVTDSAVIETMKEIRSMTQEKVDKEVLENVKAKFLGNFIMSLERPQTVASQALIKKIEGLNDNFYADYIKNINNVTVDDVLRVSKKYFRPDQAKIVVTGKAETIGEGLKKLGYPVNFYDAYGEPIADPSTMKKDAKVTTHQIADAYIKAVGGKANIEKVKTAHREGKISLMGMEGNYKEKYALPDKTAIAMEIMGMKIKTVFDGAKGYVDQMGQKIDFQKDQIDGMKGYNQLFPVLSSSFAKASVEGIVTENGVEYYKVYTKEAKRTEYYDVKTGLLAKSEIVASTPQGDMVTVNVYKNYQPFDGVLMATTIETQSGPQTFKIELSKVEFNKNVSDVDFK
ncbi:pitrilysin family protein [Weeksella sp. HMSC059D05]|uniref:M16 family metallopeptidase n=1 Tax=Weeksella sp. HMSC059D05 TaxID=1715139 RepID=UPI0008A3F780|nr:insulinase family protein [Weeksella sp. HMSC059D05]OFM84299.1 peptidase M16 [Weeksella sp. HMSC059D05]